MKQNNITFFVFAIELRCFEIDEIQSAHHPDIWFHLFSDSKNIKRNKRLQFIVIAVYFIQKFWISWAKYTTEGSRVHKRSGRLALLIHDQKSFSEHFQLVQCLLSLRFIFISFSHAQNYTRPIQMNTYKSIQNLYYKYIHQWAVTLYKATL